MSTLTINTTYDTAQILYEAQLDEIKNPIETYFNTTQIDGDNIQANILDGATYLADDSISTDKLASNSVTTAKLVDSTPSSDTGITAAKINTDAITTAKLDDSAITTAKINDGAVTTAKITSSLPKSVMLDNPTSSVNLTNLSISLGGAATGDTLVGTLTFSGLTSGKPIIISLQSTATSTGYGYMGGDTFRSAALLPPPLTAHIKLKKDGTTVHDFFMQATGDRQYTYYKLPLSSFNYIDIASSTSHAYSLYINNDVGQPYTGTFYIDSAKLVAIQIV